MNKLLIILLLFSMSCATAKVYPNLTPEHVRDNCEPVNFWHVRVLGAITFVEEFKNCSGVKALTIIAILKDDFTKEIQHQTLKLIKLHYTQYLINEVDNQKLWQVNKIKEQSYISFAKEKWLFFFYEIASSQND